MPTNKHPPDTCTSPVSDTTQRTCRNSYNCTHTLFLVYQFRHEAADPSCLSPEDKNLRHGSWFSRGGHGWYGHNAPNEAVSAMAHTCRARSSHHQLISDRESAVMLFLFRMLKDVWHASVDPCPPLIIAHQS